MKIQNIGDAVVDRKTGTVSSRVLHALAQQSIGEFCDKWGWIPDPAMLLDLSERFQSALTAVRKEALKEAAGKAQRLDSLCNVRRPKHIDFLVLSIPTRLLKVKELPNGKDVIKAINSMYGK